VGASEKNGVGEIDGDSGRRVVGDDHVAAEKRTSGLSSGKPAGRVEEAGAARASETKNARDDIARPSRNIDDDGALAAARSPLRGGTRRSEIALAGLEDHADLMHAGRNTARCSGCTAA